jgi:NAD(P)-dependent dehydrogenase (short-subunit alcohol dehydrogenase family)
MEITRPERGATLISGASSGIGEAICRRILDGGGTVVDIDLKPPRIESDRLHYIQADLSDPVAAQDAARQAASEHEITALVNNAGVNRPALLDDVTMPDYDYLMNLHVRASLILAQAVVPAMRRAKWGRIVNISSRAVHGIPYRTVYGAAKAALIGFTRTWALELGGAGITVNAIAPGPIATGLWQRTDSVVRSDPERPQPRSVLESVLTKRMGTPDEVADAALYFLSPGSAFVTGQVLFVCGGASLGAAAW